MVFLFYYDDNLHYTSKLQITAATNWANIYIFSYNGIPVW